MPRFDAIVVGGGSAGIAFAKQAAEHGAKVALIERDALGGTCVNRGCVPKKLMWQTATWRRQGLDMAEVGLTNVPEIDFSVLHKRIKAKIDDIRGSHAQSLKDCNVTLVRANAKVSEDGTVTVEGEPYAADKLILATGAKPAELDIEGAEHTVTSDDLFKWTSLPDSLAVLGGGYIGCEMSSILSALGVKVTLIDPSDRLLSPFDENLAQLAEANLKRGGVKIAFEIDPTAIKETNGGFEVIASGRPIVTAERVLNATGRTPNISAFGAFAARLDVADSGALSVDERLMTSIPDVHAVGDLADRLPLTPVATRDGSDLADMLFGDGGTLLDLDRIARAAFVIPPIAEVGDAVDAGERGARLSDGVRGAEGAEATWVGTGHNDQNMLTGFTLGGEHAAELVSLAATLIGRNETILRTAEGIHPSFAEELIGR
ncbi:NAD(P)/FAD-dependent oxidoreductase [uncultured Roseobacter sp.]|uniref:dihydrolipoyl dehydrogenase family protein n=1 Tax=uncultured Roseobacter sp. TaxID=114847 RepID=UPI00262AD720|nr:NAD(P)/FAD-dependent oxidoreductase [uncultured Roseobacter sp.]